MKKKRKLGRELLSFLLTLVMVVGLMPGMSLTVRADDDILRVFPNGSGTITVDGNSYTAVPNPGWKFDHWYYLVDEGQSEGVSTDNPWQFNGYELESLHAYFVAVDVAGVGLNKSSTTLTVGDTETLTATVSPEDATDKTVKWSVGGTNAGAVRLYSNEACTTEVGTDATSTLTVYAKGISAGSAIVTATSNADSTKSASCAVTVNKADPTAPTGLTATYGQTLANVTDRKSVA
jgi:hypothetical protein